MFREERASLGRAAEPAGVSIKEFMALFAECEASLHYTPADWQQV